MRFLIASAGAAAALSLLSIFLVDGPVAIAMSAASPGFVHAVRAATHVFEVAFGYPVTPYLWGLVLLLGGAVLLFRDRSRRLPWGLLFVGLSHLTSRLIVTFLKTVFARPRPFEALADGTWHDAFFTHGDSYPSGHAAQMWGLYFPLVTLFPKLRLPLLVFPLLISAARVGLNVHYVSDTLASAAVCAMVTWGFAHPRLRIGRFARENA